MKGRLLPAAWAQGLASFLAARSRRERMLLGVAVVGLLMALLLNLGILPAWRTLQSAPDEQARLQSQWQEMQGLQTQAALLLKQPRRSFDEAALRQGLAPLGETVHLELSAESAELTLQSARPQALAAWMLRARQEAGVVVREAQLQRSVLDGQLVWNGRLVLALAPR